MPMTPGTPNEATRSARPATATCATAARAFGVGLALLLAAACGSGSGGGGGTSASSPPSSAPTSATPTASPTPSATGGAPADAAAATAQIKQNWQRFFDPATPLTAKAAELENGARLTPLLQSFSADPRVSQVKAQVSNVVFTSPTSATVTYTLSLQGTVVEPNATGKAVLQDGTWKVSDATLCGLVALSGATAAPGCG